MRSSLAPPTISHSRLIWWPTVSSVVVPKKVLATNQNAAGQNPSWQDNQALKRRPRPFKRSSGHHEPTQEPADGAPHLATTLRGSLWTMAMSGSTGRGGSPWNWAGRKNAVSTSFWKETPPPQPSPPPSLAWM